MKYYLIFSLLLQTTIFSSARAQVSDDFSDGDFINSPTWSGDITNFIINPDGQLQLNALAEAGQSILTTESEIINNAEWSFYVKMDFNPSSSNYLDIYLVSDSENLEQSLNGYFVRIGNTQDEVSLYKQSGEKANAVKIIDGIDDRVDVSEVEMKVKVTKDINNQWEVFVDPDLSGNFISEGSAIDGDHYYSKYIGLFCKYTSTRSTKFYFDNLIISGESFSDNIPPDIDTIIVQNNSTIHIIFSEQLMESSAIDLNNYFVNNGIGNPHNIMPLNDSTVALTFKNRFMDKMENQISIHGVQDLFGNELKNYVGSFKYFEPYIIQFADLLVSEIFADPNPQVDLPDYEFLEIYNPTTERFLVFDMNLVIGKDSVPIPEFSLDPDEYLILCKTSAVEDYSTFGKVMGVQNWPTLNNRGERISLYNANGDLVFTVDYDDSWYQSIERDEGGWSLEIIDTNYPCKGKENWKASDDPSGGTPGRENTSSDELVDLKAPELSEILVISDKQLLLNLNEAIPPIKLSPSQISIDPTLNIDSVIHILPDLDKLLVICQESILENKEYALSIKDIEDCSGNHQSMTTDKFVLPSKADSLDIIINEVLFNPWPDGVDFIEIYNLSEKYIDMKNWSIANKDTNEIVTQNFILDPKSFLVLTEDFDILNNHYPGIDRDHVLEVDHLTPLNDDEGKVSLMDDSGKIIDFFEYSEELHSPFLRDPEGVSLERISFDSPTNNPDNWQSAAESVGFATPGKINSQFFIGSTTTAEEVMIEPKVFDPGSTTTNNFTMIKCRFDQPGYMASIKVLDATGREVKTIANHQPVGAEEDFKWEGENDNGEEVRMGSYIVYLEVYNASGVRKIYRKRVVIGSKM